MKILIKDNWALNLGDIAIAEAMIDQISGVFPGCDIMLESSHPDITRKYFESHERVEVIPRLFSVSDIKHVNKILSLQFIIKNTTFFWRLLKIFTISLSSVYLHIPTKNISINAYKNADMVVSAGGDFLSKNYAYYLRIYEYNLIKALKKPLFLYAQSIGPFHSKMHYFVKKSLNKIDGIFARDEKSVEILKGIGVEKNVYRTADSVIILKTTQSERIEKFILENNISKDTIGFVVRDIKYTEITDEEFNTYLKGISSIIKKYESSGKNTILIAPNLEDYDISEKIIKEFGLKSKVICTSDYLPSEIKFLLSSIRYLVSGRMHPIIIGTTGGIPVIGTGLEFKMKSYLSLVSLKEFAIDMIPFDAKKCENLMQRIESDYANIKQNMDAAIKDLSKLSEKNAQLLKEIYEQKYL